jgi:carboxyl-terminal processing protease
MLRVTTARINAVLTAGLVIAAPTKSSWAQSAANISPEARSYLSTALDTLQAIAIRRDTVSWRIVRDSAMLLAAGAMTPSDTYAAIAWALARANKHSFFQAPRPGAVSQLVDHKFGYVHVPQWGDGSAALADSLQLAVTGLGAKGVCGWIVDVRANGGGNMWPMLAGIGPLLGDTIVGAFGTAVEADQWFYKDGVSGILHAGGKLDTISRATIPAARVRNANAPVAVLFDGGTGSSGEAVVLAFRGRVNTRSFGTSSGGFSTSNRGARLPDGANMVVTTDYQVDRMRKGNGERIQPDTVIRSGPPGWPYATDNVATVAASWLSETPSCRATNGS